MGEAEWERQSGKGRVGGQVGEAGKGREGTVEWERQSGRGRVGEAERE